MRSKARAINLAATKGGSVARGQPTEGGLKIS
jgi:hypothetical protein